MSSIRELSIWLPALEAQLQDAPPDVDLVEFTGTVGKGSMGGSYRLDGKSPELGDLSGHDVFDEISTVAQRFDVERMGVILRSSRSGTREVDLIEIPDCITSHGGHIVRSLVLRDGALPALYRRQPDPTVTAGPAPSADPAALSRLIAEKIPDATPATAEQVAAVEAQLGVPLTDEVKAIYLTAGSGEIILGEDAGFYGMEIVPLDDTDFRHYYLPEKRMLDWQFGAWDTLGPDPAGRIQPLAATPLWFPVGHDGYGDVYAADLAPAQNGYRGQVIFLDHEYNAGATYLGESFTDLLVHGREGDDTGPSSRAGTAYINDGPGNTIADAAQKVDLEVLSLGTLDIPADLGPLLDHPRIRTIDANPGTLADPLQLNHFPALEYLSIGLAEWRILLDAGRVPPQLLAAGISDGSHDLAATITTANEILRLWGRPLIATTRLRQ
ncbi:SMI1/KNR4 family protein [Mycolicibacterium wolinskyi]|uniref:SMI1/KNR4 family protein n=1 Tax=Mycolicibacterium wolinskyi TaxID=59750 RepID=UPI00391775A8